MSFRLSSFRWIPALAVVALAGGAQGAEPRRGRSIEFSEPRSAEIITNLNQLTTKKDGLKQLEADLYAPLQTFAPKTSMDGVFDPPQRRHTVSAVQSKRAKELLDRQKNWPFLDPDDLTAGPTAEQIFNLPEYDADGQEKKKGSVIERYYEKEERKRVAREKAGKSKADELYGESKDSDSKDEIAAKDDPKGSRSLGGRESATGKLFGTEPGSSTASFGHGTFSDIFGMGEKTPSVEDVAKHKAHMEEFRSLLNSGWQPPASSFNSLGGIADSAKPAFSSSGAFDSLPGSSRREGASSFSGVAPAFNSAPARSAFPDLNARSASSLSPTPTPAPATRLTPPTPTFTAPRRAF
jgi:hypothetical protein